MEIALGSTLAAAFFVLPVRAQPPPDGDPAPVSQPAASPQPEPGTDAQAQAERAAPSEPQESESGKAGYQPPTISDDSASVPAPVATDSNRSAQEVAGEEPGPAAAASSRRSGEDRRQETAPRILYYLQSIEVRGNSKTLTSVIAHYIPLQEGDLLDVEDPLIEAIRWRLMGTGWFNEVRLSLERGTTRGWVVLVVEVEERNTVVITRIVAGLSKSVRQSTSTDTQVDPYAGLGIAETNLFGLGNAVSLTGVYSAPQQGIDLRYSNPSFLGSRFGLSGGFFYNNARDFFGYEENIVDIRCPEPDPDDPTACDPDVDAKTAVVIYDRSGISLGTGQDLTSTMRYTLQWQGELVNVRSKPLAASTLRGAKREPIDFHINDGWSAVSSLNFTLLFDRRDDPALPSRGQLASFGTRAGTRLLGSDYNFTRFEGSYRFWVPLSWGHVLSPGAYFGIVVGEAPFFYRFYASDLSDLVPSRLLDLNLDHRGPPDLLGTSIAAMRAEELAGRVDLEYRLPLHRGGGGIRGIDAYARVGLYALARREDLRIAVAGFEGASRVPVDLTFDLGLHADTALGLFQLGFSSLVRSLPEL